MQKCKTVYQYETVKSAQGCKRIFELNFLLVASTSKYIDCIYLVGYCINIYIHNIYKYIHVYIYSPYVCFFQPTVLPLLSLFLIIYYCFRLPRFVCICCCFTFFNYLCLNCCKLLLLFLNFCIYSIITMLLTFEC